MLRIVMNDFRMMIFIEDRECKASSLFNKEWLNDSFGMEV